MPEGVRQESGRGPQGIRHRDGLRPPAGALRAAGHRSVAWFARSAAGPQLLDQDLAVADMAG